jgi:endonuclease/exonuclease/phosphatase family metal-dependent hydrolase
VGWGLGNARGMRVRVVTLNVWNDEGDPRRLGLINRGLRELEPDLVAMQEVVHGQEAELLAGTGLHGTHQADTGAVQSEFAAKYGGKLVASRLPHRVVEVLDLRMSDAQDVPWFAIAVTVGLPDVGEVLFIGTSTSWRLSAESARERQTQLISDLDARHRRELPTIIAGDFNAEPESASIRYLTGRQSLNGRSVSYHDAWATVNDGPGYTWTSENPNARKEIDAVVRQRRHRRRIDYVFVGSWDAHPNAYCRVTEARLAFNEPVDGVWLSDHFGVVADLEVEMAAKG